MEGLTSGATEGCALCGACSPAGGGVGIAAPQFAQNFGAPAVRADPHSIQNTLPPLFETNSLETSPFRRVEVWVPDHCQMPTGLALCEGR